MKFSFEWYFQFPSWINLCVITLTVLLILSMLLTRITGPAFDYMLYLQNPTIFSGSVRENLDPNNEYTDEDIWCALEKARMKRFICRSGSGLETSLTDTGGQPSLVLRFVSFAHHG